jgi:hypothetical protein
MSKEKQLRWWCKQYNDLNVKFGLGNPDTILTVAYISKKIKQLKLEIKP